jgi:hypothetical protein
VKAIRNNIVAGSVSRPSETPMRKPPQYRGGARTKGTKGAKQMKFSNIRSKYAAVIAGVVAAAFIGLPAAHADQLSSDLDNLYSGLYSAKHTAVGKTRAQVKAELADAIRTGDIYAGGEPSWKLNELFPNRYQEKSAVADKTPERVKAELAQAVRTGDIYAGGEPSWKLNELFPGLYPSQSVTR